MAFPPLAPSCMAGGLRKRAFDLKRKLRAKLQQKRSSSRLERIKKILAERKESERCTCEKEERLAKLRGKPLHPRRKKSNEECCCCDHNEKKDTSRVAGIRRRLRMARLLRSTRR